MLKNNKKTCKKLYKYYKKQFKLCTKDLLNTSPNYLTGLEYLMIYLQYMQDTLALNESFLKDKSKASENFITLSFVLDCYSSYRKSLVDLTQVLTSQDLTEEAKDKKVKELAKDAHTSWAALWKTISLAMEGWILNECSMK